jgi:hypothetical protein
MNTNELLKRLQAKKRPVLDAGGCGPVKPRPPIKARQPSSSALVELLRRQQDRIAAKAASPLVSSLAAVLPADDDSKEVSLGTVASPQVHRAAAPRLADRLAEKQAKTFCPTAAGKGQERKASGGNQTEGCIKEESAAAVPPDALQGVPLSDQEREDIAAGLTPAMARRAAESRVDTFEWLLGLERMTQEQAERVASFRKMDAALISARGKMPYLDTLGIPRFPPDCEPKYRHREGGQPLLDTLLELKAQDWAIDSRVTREGSPDDWQRWHDIKAKRRK